MFGRLALAMLLLGGCATPAPPAALPERSVGQRAWAAACEDFDEWDKPGPPFRIYGRTYYVGTCGISALLIARDDGLVVIDSGTDRGADTVLANIRALGFDPREVRWLLTSHEHFDHVGGMARLQAATGATVVASAPAAAVLRTGRTAPDDPQAGSEHPAFTPVAGPMRVVENEQALRLGPLAIHPLFTPGHTQGALSWAWRECEGTACQELVYVDSLNPISADGYRFSDNPELVSAFRAGIAKIATRPCDIAIAPHPGSADLRRRLSGGTLRDPDGCRNYAATVSRRLERRLAEETGG